MLKRLQNVIWIALFGGFVVGFCVQVSQASSVPPPNSTQQTAATQQSTDKKDKNHDMAQPLWIPIDSIGLYTLVLAAFTGLLVVVSGVQGYFLLRADKTARTTANAAKQSAQAAADSVQTAKEFLERAYIFGGCGHQVPTIKNGRVIMQVTATHGNYGKTQGFVEFVFIEHCLERDLPSKPVYKTPIPVMDSLPPTGEWKQINKTVVGFDITDEQIYYGRLIYLDVFKKRHYSSFIYRFLPDGSHEPVSGCDPEYWDWN